MLWGEDGGLGEVSARRVNVLFHWHFSRVPRILITALHKSKSLEGDFLLSSHGHLDTKAAAEGPSPGGGTAGIIPQGREERAEAEGQGRSALGRHDVELLEQAEGLFLGPPSPPARNLRRTLGDAGTGLMVTWSNRQLTASVPGARGGRRGLRASYPLMRLRLVLLATAQPQRACGFLCKEKLCSDKERGDAS